MKFNYICNEVKEEPDTDGGDTRAQTRSGHWAPSGMANLPPTPIVEAGENTQEGRTAFAQKRHHLIYMSHGYLH